MVTFGILAVVMIVGALGVVLLRQPVHAALALVGTLLTLAVTYVTLEAHFLAAIQVIVYAGAVMVLFLFVIMLLHLRGVSGSQRPLRGVRWVAYGTAIATAAAVALIAFWDGRPAPDPALVSQHLQGGSAGGIGDVLFGEMLLAFQLVGVLLLTGVIGAVALVQRRSAETIGTAPDPAGAPPAAGGTTGGAGRRAASDAGGRS